MRELWRILNTKCEQASTLASHALDEPLSWTDHLALAGHTLVCRSCREFARQLQLLHRAATAAGTTEQRLPEAARSRIANSLRDPESPSPPLAQ